jgi:3-phenylpropionate/trans-cinnamate dioxygenase ferredoxin reductase subunit
MFDFRQRVDVTVTQTGETFPCPVGESVLRGMLRLGRKGIPVGCVNGGCGVCKIKVREGEVTRLGPISRAHVSVEEESQGYTLACRVSPACALTLDVAGKFEKPFTKGHAAAAQTGSVSTNP